ncbi:MAG TPA: tRNA glutamyl-Q(34) synthetase GluQRS [Usitatibacter sp.]|nr:tRNA glutamyl-Q(34) synthetase GluQRS [Usitatibacter sp.]
MTAGYRGRFAPSPTGPLHFGSLVAALASWLDARAAGGAWRVRIEDVDETRTVPGAADEILRALESHGLRWDGPVVWQSRRTHLYAAALERLRGAGHIYRCRCSRREISDSALHGPEGAIYPGTCRALAIGNDVPGADRIAVEGAPITFADRRLGRLSQVLSHETGDFVLRRRDGLYAYQLAVVVDDAEQGITDVVRGADLLWSTPRQVFLQRLLNAPTPRYLHIPVARNAHGEKLSKQTRAPALQAGAAVSTLRAGLSFLGQPEVDGDTVSEILAQATAAWNPGNIAAGAV